MNFNGLGLSFLILFPLNFRCGAREPLRIDYLWIWTPFWHDFGTILGPWGRLWDKIIETINLEKVMKKLSKQDPWPPPLGGVGSMGDACSGGTMKPHIGTSS